MSWAWNNNAEWPLVLCTLKSFLIQTRTSPSNWLSITSSTTSSYDMSIVQALKYTSPIVPGVLPWCFSPLSLSLRHSKTSLTWLFYLHPYKRHAQSTSIFPFGDVFYVLLLSRPLSYSLVWPLVAPWYMQSSSQPLIIRGLQYFTNGHGPSLTNDHGCWIR